MIRPATKHTIEILGGVVGVVALAGVTLAVMLARGPIPLDFLTPTLSRLLSEAAGDYAVDVAHAQLHWSGTHNTLELRVKGVDLRDSDGGDAAHIPELDIGISSLGLSEGRFSPTRVSVVSAQVALYRDKFGTFSVGRQVGPSRVAEAQPSAGPTDSALPLILDWFTQSDTDGPASYLNEIEIKQAYLTFTDDRTGITINAPSSHLILARTKNGLRGELQAEASIGNEEFTLGVDLDMLQGGQGGQADLRFSPVTISHLAPLSEFFTPFAVFDLPVSGVATIDLGDGGLVREAQLSLKGDSGTFGFGLNSDAPRMTVDTASLNATYYPPTGHIDLEWFTFKGPNSQGTLTAKGQVQLSETAPIQAEAINIDLFAEDLALDVPELFDGVFELPSLVATAQIGLGEDWSVGLKGLHAEFPQGRLFLTGSAHAAPGSPVVIADGVVKNFQAADLGRVWPKGVIPPAREWVVPHVHSGLLTEGQLKVRAPAGAFAQKPPHNSAIDFVFRVEDGSASYVTGLPPLTDVTANMHMTGQTFHLDLVEANILGTKIKTGSVDMQALGVKGTPITVGATGAGPLEDLLEIVDAEPLGFISAYGASTKDFAGTADLRFDMTIPQKSKIEVEDVKFKVAANGKNVKLPSFLDRDLNNGTIELEVTELGLKGTGEIEINGVPGALEYTEKFRNRGETPSGYRLFARLDDGARAALGFNTGDAMVGEVPVELTAVGNGTSIARFDVKTDLLGARIDLPDINLAKPVGAPLKAWLSGTVSPDGQVTLNKLDASGSEIELDGSAVLGPNGQLLSARFEGSRIPGLFEGTISAQRTKTDSLAVSIAGDYLNAAPLLEQFGQGDGTNTASWRLAVNLDEVDLRKGVLAKEVVIDAEAAEGKVTFADARGRFASGGDFFAFLSKSGDTGRKLSVTASNAGELINGLTGIDGVKQGRAAMTVMLPNEVADDTVTRLPGETTRMNGELKISDFKVVDVPVLARLLNIGSLQGMSDLLQGEGISFAQLTVPFWLEEELFGIEDGRASGQALGLTVNGVIDRQREVADLRGSIVPAYMLNSVLGYVPVVGQLLVNRKGEGVIGFTYGVEGPLSEPQLVVNPLSALAPGFLRRLFEMEEAEARSDLPAPTAP